MLKSNGDANVGDIFDIFEDDRLIAADVSDAVVGPQGLVQASAQLLEQTIPSAMAQAVVNVLEAIASKQILLFT